MYIGELSKQAILYDGLDMANGHRKRSSQSAGELEAANIIISSRRLPIYIAYTDADLCLNKYMWQIQIF